MKNFGIMIAAAMVALTAMSARAQEAEGDGSPLTFDLGVATNDIWRGGNCAGLSFMGDAEFAAGGFSAGIAGNSAIVKDDYTEIDLYASYSVGGAFLSLTDYTWTQDKFEFFGPYKTYHYLELGVGYDFSEKTDLPLSISYNVMLAGANRKADDSQGHSSYIEISYAPSLECGLDLGFTVGAAIENEESLMYTRKDGFNFAELKFEMSKTYNLKNFCTVTPSAAVICNPTGLGEHGEVYFVGGVSFGF
ncbi:MAG: hypothetical protein J5595_00455 [Bacteroidales bacterium]|nr:hypothetical protein [Bacteroidales bacterium]